MSVQKMPNELLCSNTSASSTEPLNEINKLKAPWVNPRELQFTSSILLKDYSFT